MMCSTPSWKQKCWKCPLVVLFPLLRFTIASDTFFSLFVVVSLQTRLERRQFSCRHDRKICSFTADSTSRSPPISMQTRLEGRQFPCRHDWKLCGFPTDTTGSSVVSLQTRMVALQFPCRHDWKLCSFPADTTGSSAVSLQTRLEALQFPCRHDWKVCSHTLGTASHMEKISASLLSLAIPNQTIVSRTLLLFNCLRNQILEFVLHRYWRHFDHQSRETVHVQTVQKFPT